MREAEARRFATRKTEKQSAIKTCFFEINHSPVVYSRIGLLATRTNGSPRHCRKPTLKCNLFCTDLCRIEDLRFEPSRKTYFFVCRCYFRCAFSEYLRRRPDRASGIAERAAMALDRAVSRRPRGVRHGRTGGGSASTSAPLTAESGKQSMRESPGRQCLRASPSLPSAQSKWRHRIQTCFTPVPASPTSALPSAPATEFTNPRDGGQTWKNIGLRDSRQISRIVIDPKNPDIVYVGVLGHAYGPNAERGVFKSTDGGTTWTHVLDKGPNVGVSDLAIAIGQSEHPVCRKLERASSTLEHLRSDQCSRRRPLSLNRQRRNLDATDCQRPSRRRVGPRGRRCVSRWQARLHADRRGQEIRPLSL